MTDPTTASDIEAANSVDRAITSRRAVRAFLPDPVSPDLVRHILQVSAQAPSGTNMQPWNFNIVLA